MTEEILSANVVAPEQAVDVQAIETPVEQPVESVKVETAIPPQEVKPTPQSAEDNSKFAAIRRDAESKASLKAKDELIAEMYGEQGIKTYAEYQQALKQQAEEQKLADLKEKGIDPDEYKRLVEENPDVKEAREFKAKQATEAKRATEFKEFVDDFPEVKPDSIPKEVWEMNAKGIPLSFAYAKYELKKSKSVETVQAKNAANAQSSMGSVSSAGAIENTALTDEMVAEMTTQQLSKRWKDVKKLYNMK